jgi:hypothetical protein
MLQQPLAQIGKWIALGDSGTIRAILSSAPPFTKRASKEGLRSKMHATGIDALDQPAQRPVTAMAYLTVSV